MDYDRIDVDGAAHHFGQPSAVRRFGGLVARHEPEVAFHEAERRLLGQRPEHGHVGMALDRVAELALVARAGEPVEDDPGDRDRRIEHLQPLEIAAIPR
jgi:hypothetical protein